MPQSRPQLRRPQKGRYMARIVEIAPSQHHRAGGEKKGSRRRDDKIVGRGILRVINIVVDYVMPTCQFY